MIETLKKIFAKYVDVPTDEITADSVILRDLGLNSYSIMEIISDIEDEFDMDIPDAVLTEFKTVGDLITYLEDAA
ncbi:MAG: acyl carrier protein [Faecalibacterium sp.]|nr:acyl carrier protein [Ruminococcus sp.]MCM1392665.1 acyl carrier protein [Ruminococcus sp.]MCM1486316.1 acyl carrier protein [Faecalibacterium sp.]